MCVIYDYSCYLSVCVDTKLVLFTEVCTLHVTCQNRETDEHTNKQTNTGYYITSLLKVTTVIIISSLVLHGAGSSGTAERRATETECCEGVTRYSLDSRSPNADRTFRRVSLPFLALLCIHFLSFVCPLLNFVLYEDRISCDRFVFRTCLLYTSPSPRDS